MRHTTLMVCAATLAAAALLGQAAAQGVKKVQKPDSPSTGIPDEMLPKPGPEHELLKKDVGVWDATVESSMGPGTSTSVSKGVETNTLMAGGLWLVTQFKGEFLGKPFEGSGVLGYDPAKKKYVGTWVDSMSTGVSLLESTYDPAKKTLTGTFEGPDMSGKVVKMKSVTQWKDDDSRIFTLSVPASERDEIPAMRITYRRRAANR
jgi:hypothetical protein